MQATFNAQTCGGMKVFGWDRVGRRCIFPLKVFSSSIKVVQNRGEIQFFLLRRRSTVNAKNLRLTFQKCGEMQIVKLLRATLKAKSVRWTFKMW